MKISTERALAPATSHRDVLHRIAWAADGQDPELSGAAVVVLAQLEAAEAEVARLQLEAGDRQATNAEQVALPVRERPHLAGRALPEAPATRPATLDDLIRHGRVAVEDGRSIQLRVVGEE